MQKCQFHKCKIIYIFFGVLKRKLILTLANSYIIYKYNRKIAEEKKRTPYTYKKYISGTIHSEILKFKIRF